MTLKAYLDNIQTQTGKTPQDFLVLAEEKGLLKQGVKTGQIVSWLKEDFGLGQGHAMAIVLTLRRLLNQGLASPNKSPGFSAETRPGGASPMMTF